MNKVSILFLLLLILSGCGEFSPSTYSNEKLTSKIDTREDKFGVQVVKEDVCESIIKIDKTNQVVYQLIGCKDNEEEIHVIQITNE